MNTAADSRSMTGCGTCKTRRKKCDEAHPKCQRCISMGLECSGYQYVERMSAIGRKARKPRTKSAPLHAFVQQEPTGDASVQSFGVVNPNESLGTITGSQIHFVPDISPQSSTASTQARDDSLVRSSTSHVPSVLGRYSGLPLDVAQSLARKEHIYPNSLSTIVESVPSSSMTRLYDLGPERALLAYMNQFAESSQTTTFGTHNDEHFADHTQMPPGHWDTQLNISASQSYESLTKTDREEEDDEILEEPRETLGINLALDQSVPDNLFAFALQKSAQWSMLVMFQPLMIRSSMKERIAHQINSSASTRGRITLISRAIGALLKSPVPDQSCELTISILHTDMYQKAARYALERATLEPNLVRQKALAILTDYLDIIAIQGSSYPFCSWYQLLCGAALPFRDACPEPLGQPVYLPGILNEPPFCLSFFVGWDVCVSITFGRPMLCQYDAGFSLELCDEIYDQQRNYGFQWILGVPDQLVLLFAWINTLYEYHGANLDPGLLRKIEDDLSKIKMSLVESSDPVLRLGRTAVQEAWRQAAYIYLYMTLYGASAQDSRVVQARRTFMRLVDGTKQGHSPDGFMIVPMIIAGVVCIKRRDRDTVRKCIGGLRSSRYPVSIWNDILRMLEDVWVGPLQKIGLQYGQT
ncbi:Fungal specific transcription factor domain [Rhizoctonia solani]|uniref:Fungal specific transcription factor domain n=1 Tax=Rhizoctonia solani TaxID=456999 RepID=A0A8H8NRX0_9AGAM|nr:Fungal specific transcription factor domain [Rhizoctonia solani]QRW17213.1 Fungal specific transcription factor domain [Rhizoctonia solani]